MTKMLLKLQAHWWQVIFYPLLPLLVSNKSEHTERSGGSHEEDDYSDSCNTN